MFEFKCIFVLLFLFKVQSHKIFDDVENDEGDVVEIEDEMSRARKSLDTNFPDELLCKFPVEGETKHFSLKKNDNFREQIPLFRMTEGNPEEIESSSAKRYAPYKDPTTGASMLLHCVEEYSCKWYGTFHHEGSAYRVQPDNDEKWNRKHRVHKLKKPNHKSTRDHIVSGKRKTHKTDREEKGQPANERLPRHHVVELMMFLDDSVYKFFKYMNNDDDEKALEKMQMYYTLVANDMDLRYESLNEQYPDVKLNVMVNGLVYAKNAEDFPWVEKYVFQGKYLPMYDAEDAIGLFAGYQNSARKKFPRYDHAMQFSRRDLAFYEDGWQPGLLGIAFTGTTCVDPAGAVSIIEDFLYGNAGQTAAHELGHSLGAQHDGDVGCDDKEDYIMSVAVEDPKRSTAEHTWKFSSCSSKAIHHHLSWKKSGRCTLKNHFNENDYQRTHSISPGGRVYSLEEQCQLRFGFSGETCEKPHARTCSLGILCTSSFLSQCISIPAMSGSTCGPHHVCDKNRCVRITDSNSEIIPLKENNSANRKTITKRKNFNRKKNRKFRHGHQ